jgi:Nuclease-related domain
MMARSHPHRDNERERFPVAWEDDDAPGLSVHALTREDMEAILASLPDEPDDEPPLRLPSRQRAAAAARRPARRSYGTPGGTAQAEYQRRRQAEHAGWARTRPLRLAATVLAGLGGLLVVAVAGLPLPAALAVTLAAGGGAWWRLRFHPSPEAAAWRRAADGERHLARLLEPLAQQGWGVEHDLPVRGATGNLNHVVIGPPGIFAIDLRHYRGRLRLSHDGLLWHGRTFLLPTLSATPSKADRLQDRIAAPDIWVSPIIAVLGGMVPGGQVTSMGVTVIPARRLPDVLRSLPPTLTTERAREVAAQIERRLATERRLTLNSVRLLCAVKPPGSRDGHGRSSHGLATIVPVRS